MRRILMIPLSLFTIFLAVGCSNDMRTGYENYQSSISEQINIEKKTETASSAITTDSTVNTIALPDFLYGYLDYGTYNVPLRIPNANNYERIKISESNKLDFPESSVIAVIVNKWGSDPYLLSPREDQICELFDYLKAMMLDEPDAEDINKREDQDTELSAVMLTACGNYALVTVRGYKNDAIEVYVEQENESDPLIIKGTSDDLHKCLREICQLNYGNIQLIESAKSIKYLTNQGKWELLTDTQMSMLKNLTGAVQEVNNYSSGCPFDLHLLIETDDEEFHAEIATDSCGIIIIEDQTYQVTQDQRDALQLIFKDVSWK